MSMQYGCSVNLFLPEPTKNWDSTAQKHYVWGYAELTNGASCLDPVSWEHALNEDGLMHYKQPLTTNPGQSTANSRTITCNNEDHEDWYNWTDIQVSFQPLFCDR